RGYAVECRINAEDATAGWVPSTGRLTAYRAPSGAGVRVDSGVEENDEISVFYDPMIAKLIVHASTREQGLDRMARALREFLILGVRTSIPLHLWLMRHPAVRSGEVDTAWLEREWRVPAADSDEVLRAAVTAALFADEQRSSVFVAQDGAVGPPTSAWRVAARRSGLN